MYCISIKISILLGINNVLKPPALYCTNLHSVEWNVSLAVQGRERDAPSLPSHHPLPPSPPLPPVPSPELSAPRRHLMTVCDCVPSSVGTQMKCDQIFSLNTHYLSVLMSIRIDLCQFPHSSHITHHTHTHPSHTPPSPSHITHTLTPHTYPSHITPSHIHALTHHPSHITPSHIHALTHHPSHITPHTSTPSHITPHISPLTHHPSHITPPALTPRSSCTILQSPTFEICDNFCKKYCRI